MKHLLAASLFLLALPAAGDVMELAGYRDWKSNDGKTLKALLLKVGPNSYSLKSHRDGRTYDIPLDRISADDQKLVSDAGALLDSVKSKAESDGKFTTLGNPTEDLWQLIIALDRVTEFSQLVCGDYRSSSGAFSLTAKDFRRESNKSFIIVGEHIMARIVISAGPDTLLESGDKLHITRKLEEREVDYNYYTGWHYDRKLKVLRRMICARKSLFQPTVGTNAPYKILSCARETVGVGEYIVFTLQTQFTK